MLEVYYLQMDYRGKVRFDWSSRTNFINTFITDEGMFKNQINNVAIIKGEPIDKLDKLREDETYLIVYDVVSDGDEDDQVVKLGLTKSKIISHLLDLKSQLVEFSNLTILKQALMSLSDFKEEVSLTKQVIVINKVKGAMALDTLHVVKYLFNFNYFDLKDKHLVKSEFYRYSDLESFVVNPNETLNWEGKYGNEVPTTEVVKALEKYPLICISGEGRGGKVETRVLSRSDMPTAFVDLSFWFKDIKIDSVVVTTETSLLGLLDYNFDEILTLYKMIFNIINFNNFENPFEFTGNLYAFDGQEVRFVTLSDIILDYFSDKKIKYVSGLNNKCILRRLNVEKFKSSDLARLNDFLVVIQINGVVETTRMVSETLVERLRAFNGQTLPPYACVIPVENFMPIEDFVRKSRIISIKDLLNNIYSLVQHSLTGESSDTKISESLTE